MIIETYKSGEARKNLITRFDVYEPSQETEVTTTAFSLHPLTASEEEKKFVSLTLQLKLGKGYPEEETPDIRVREGEGETTWI